MELDFQLHDVLSSSKRSSLQAQTLAAFARHNLQSLQPDAPARARPAGGEALSLRYDLTVPFARYCALNGLGSIKRLPYRARVPARPAAGTGVDCAGISTLDGSVFIFTLTIFCLQYNIMHCIVVHFTYSHHHLLSMFTHCMYL